MAAMNPGHVIASSVDLPVRKDLHADLVRLEDRYRTSEYEQRLVSPGQILVAGPVPPSGLTVVAQHAVNHFDAFGRRKLADRGTGGLVELLAQVLGIHGIVSAAQLPNVESQQHRQARMAVMAAEAGLPCIDLHGMACDGYSAIDIGLGREPSDASRRIADTTVTIGERLGVRVTLSQRFPALGPGRLVNTLLEGDLSAVQVEVCACLRPPNAGAAETTIVVELMRELVAATSPGRAQTAPGRPHTAGYRS